MDILKLIAPEHFLLNCFLIDRYSGSGSKRGLTVYAAPREDSCISGYTFKVTIFASNLFVKGLSHEFGLAQCSLALTVQYSM